MPEKAHKDRNKERSIGISQRLYITKILLDSQ